MTVEAWQSQEADLLYAMADGLERIAQTRQLHAPPSPWQQLAEACQRVNRGTRVEVAGGIRALDTASTASSLLAVSQPQLPAVQQQRLFLRDIVPVVPTSTLSTPLVRELSPQSTEMGASGVAEGSLKPDVGSAFDFEDASVSAGTLAASITATRQLWQDSPAFAAYVSNSRLPYLLKLREEFACFRGNGEVVNAGIVGLMHDPAVGSASPVAGSLVQTIVSLAAVIAGNGAIPDYAFVNAVDYFNAAGKAYTAAGGGPGASTDALYLLPTMLPTLALAQGSVVVGDFANGAVIVDRQQVAVEVFDQHADYRAHNLELVRGEERVSWRATLPWAFAHASGGSF